MSCVTNKSPKRREEDYSALFDSLTALQNEQGNIFYRFCGTINEIRKLCRDYPAADEFYFELIAGGGFAIFDGALRFFSISMEPEARNVIIWNKDETWKHAYRKYAYVAESFWCFGEDVFGNQYCFKDSGVYLFDSDTAEFKYLAATFTEWLKLVFKRPALYSGQAVAASWNVRHGQDNPLTPDRILVMIVPFASGGMYELKNLFPMEAVKSMVGKSDLARSHYYDFGRYAFAHCEERPNDFVHIAKYDSLDEAVAERLHWARRSYQFPRLYSLAYHTELAANLYCLERLLSCCYHDYPYDFFHSFLAEKNDDSEILSKINEGYFRQIEKYFVARPVLNIPKPEMASIILNALNEVLDFPEKYNFTPWEFHWFCNRMIDVWDGFLDNFPELGDIGMNYVFLPMSNSRIVDFGIGFRHGDKDFPVTPIVDLARKLITEITAYYQWRNTLTFTLRIEGVWRAQTREKGYKDMVLIMRKNGMIQVQPDIIVEYRSYLFTDATTIHSNYAVYDGGEAPSFGSDGAPLVFKYRENKLELTDYLGREVTFLPEK